MTRLSEIFGRVFFKKYYSPVELFPYKTGITATEFREIFYENQILEVKFKNIYGRYVSSDADLHNPRKEWDRYRAKSHNKYDANIIRSAYIEAKESKNLSKSPTARTFLESGATGEKIKFINKNGEVVVERNEAKAAIELKLEKRPNEYSIDNLFNHVKELIAKKGDEISKYRIFQSIAQFLDFEDRHTDNLQEEADESHEEN